ncbi:CoA pyrophosphatase [Flavobacterium sp.]|uniref:NUDIX hydrolase n=1 Tax=Flavobacterium sp. TaxID=239 RepID=UPI00286A4F33|nr:CoA pyrophosphatase [Flavobacterium sp.]
MDFNVFLDFVPKIAQENLLSDVAHQKMEPQQRRDLLKNIDLNTLNPRESAVMMLFYPKESITHLALIIRNAYPGIHSSQIAFPGGKVELFDTSLEETALRETHEEIGISSDKITVIRPFTKIYIPPSNFMVYPFLGYSNQELIFNPDPSEVAGIIELPITDFLDDTNVISEKIKTSYTSEIIVPAFKIKEHIVWGATAMMMSELKELLKKVL